MITPVKFVLLLVIFLTPLITPFNNYGYEQAKVVIFSYLVDIAALIYVFYLLKNRSNINLKLSSLNYAGLNFILGLFLTSLLGVNPLFSFFGASPYFQGFFLYFHLFIFYLLICLLKTSIKNIAVTLISSSLLVSLISIWQYFQLHFLGILIPTYAGRVVSSFGQPNFYAGFLLLTLPFCFYLFKEANKKIIYFGLISGFILMVSIFLSFSRTTIILALFLLILGLLSEIKIKFALGFIILLVILISSLIAIKFSSGLVGTELSKPFFINDPYLAKDSVEKRAYIWPLGFKIFLEKPLLGFGLENISTAFSSFFSNKDYILLEKNLHINHIILMNLRNVPIDSAHNYLLDLGLFSGVIGVIAYLFLCFLLIKKAKGSFLLVPFVTYLIWIQFQNQSIVQLIFFWMLAGTISQKS